MIKEVEETLRNLAEDDKLVLYDMLTASLDERKEEPELIQLAANTEAFRGDGVMTLRAHKAYQDATGDSLLDRGPAKKGEKEEVKRWGGEDSTLVKEWKERNKVRQEEEFKRLLEKRKR